MPTDSYCSSRQYDPYARIRPQKVQAIINTKLPIKFAPLENKALVQVLQSCLQRDPTQRPGIKDLLQHSFLSPASIMQSMLGTSHLTPHTETFYQAPQLQKKLLFFIEQEGVKFGLIVY